MAKRALVVDDSPYIQKELTKILERHGCEVVATASNGLEAVKKYKELKPDFVTLDLVMPQMGGIQTLVLLRKIDPQATVIMVSSMSSRDKIVECAKAGARHYILKPFEEEKVVEVLNKVVFGTG
ncbi:response regulator [Deferrisoma camini]|uniref:response regulator n=1 Tax=Deferrisoma camini TaxID=1035120 RepID=UPI00046CE7E7|nr:response regulator [Deferrisoma camini]